MSEWLIAVAYVFLATKAVGLLFLLFAIWQVDAAYRQERKAK